MNSNKFKNTEIKLATENIRVLIARYSIPSAIALVFFSVQSIIDGIIVGSYLGADALASVSLILPGYTIPTSIVLILSVGSMAQMSIAMGEQDYAKFRTTLKTGGVSIITYSLLITFIFNVFPCQLAELLGARGELLEGSLDYMRGLMPFAAANLCSIFLDCILRTLGHPRFAMIMIVATILFDNCLTIVFVTQFDMGIFGVGLGTGISMTIGVIVSGFVVLKQLHRNFNLKSKKEKFSWPLLGKMFYNGSSEGVTEMAMGITIVLFNLAFLKNVGKEGVAAFAVTNYIIFIGTSILLGVSDGAIPVVSYNYGANSWHRVRRH